MLDYSDNVPYMYFNPWNYHDMVVYEIMHEKWFHGDKPVSENAMKLPKCMGENMKALKFYGLAFLEIVQIMKNMKISKYMYIACHEKT